jgi:hypothetical protein
MLSIPPKCDLITAGLYLTVVVAADEPLAAKNGEFTLIVFV